MAAGEGIETVLSLRCVMPDMPMVAALSAAHLAAILFPVTLRRLYIVRDNDAAGEGAAASLIDRAKAARNRGDRFVADAGGLQRGSPLTRRRCATDGDQGATRPGRRRALSWNCRREPERGNEARRRGVSCRIGSWRFPLFRRGPRPRPSLEGDRGGKRPGPAMASGRLFSVGGKPPLHREAK